MEYANCHITSLLSRSLKIKERKYFIVNKRKDRGWGDIGHYRNMKEKQTKEYKTKRPWEKYTIDGCHLEGYGKKCLEDNGE